MRTLNLPLILLALAVLLLPAPPLHADAPRVGLVLSGGGARGLAHVGVLKYLEEHGIRPTAITGTSMGAIVGGLYASGLNAAQIETIVRELQWQRAFSDTTPRDQQSFRRKQEEFDFLVQAKLRFKDGGLHIPLGLIEGQHLNLILHDLVPHVAHVQDFDRLPIPFRAVATDVASGNPEILARGDLATAMRASMSIPGIFSPVELNGKLLVDGGVSNNIPVDIAQAMGVDRLIVIDVGSPLYAKKELDNMLTLMDQLTNILTRKNSEQQLARLQPGDVLIAPLLDTVATLDFEKADEAIRLGYESARLQEVQLAALAGGAGAIEVPPVAKRKSPVIDAIRIESDARISKKMVLNKLSQKTGKRLRKTALERDIAEIYALNEFSRVDYVINEENGRNVLVVRARANPGGANYMKLGMSWDQDSSGVSEFGLAASWYQKGVNRLGGEWYSILSLGGRAGFTTDFYQPLDTEQRFFLDARYQYQAKRLNVVADNRILARAQIDSHRIEFAPGFNIGNVAALSAGGFARSSNADIEIGAPEFSSRADNDLGWFAELRYDTLDRPHFPARGSRVLARYNVGRESWGSTVGYESWDTSARKAFTFGRNTFSVNARWARVDPDNGANDITIPAEVQTLGGFLALSGFTRDALAGNELAFGSVMYYRRLTEQSLLPVDFPVYFGASLEAGNVWEDPGDAAWGDLITAGSVFLGIDSPLGPIYLGAGIGERGQRALYLQIGQVLD